MKIRWTSKKIIEKRVRKNVYRTFDYREGVSEIDLKCQWCRKENKMKIHRVDTDHLDFPKWSKICKCKFSQTITNREKRALGIR